MAIYFFALALDNIDYAFKIILQVSVVLPHSNFRLFFTMDPRHGELSPAMRNRGVEIFLEDPHRVTNDQMLSTMKDDTSIWQGKIPIDEFAYYSNASIATRRFELMKGLKTVSKIWSVIGFYCWGQFKRRL